MGIEVLKDCKLEELQNVGKEIKEGDLINLKNQSGTYDLRYTYELRWLLNIEDNIIKVSFIRT